MGVSLNQSQLKPAFEAIAANPGSPYLRINAIITAGGNLYRPMQVTRLVVNMDTINNYADETFIYLAIPSGDVMEYLSPYQDDIMIEVIIEQLTETAAVDPEGNSVSRKYKAYFDDQVKNPIESSNDVGQTSTEMANLSNIDVVVFRLEEQSVEQMKYKRTGVANIKNSVPVNAAVALLSNAAKSIQLDNSEKITGPSVDKGYNPLVRNTISIPDGTATMDVPDIIQNENGGIYREALGFYIRNNHMYIWPLYKVNRWNTAKKFLRVYLAPDPKSSIVERTWMIPENAPDMLEVWCAGDISVDDESMASILANGTAIRQIDPQSVMEDFVSINDNTVSVSKSSNNIQFKDTELVSGRTIVNNGPRVSNPYALSSKMAKNKGIKVVVMWNHSSHSLIHPGMAVELNYDYMGELRTVLGTLVESYTIIDMMGQGMVNHRWKSVTGLVLFIDRNDPNFTEWVNAGAPGATPQPNVG